MKNVKVTQELFLHPHSATVLGVLWLGVERSLLAGGGSEIPMEALARVISQAQTRGYFSQDIRFYDNIQTLLSWLRVALSVLVADRMVYVLEIGEKVGLAGDSQLTLPTGIFGYLDLKELVNLWEEELKTHMEERE